MGYPAAEQNPAAPNIASPGETSASTLSGGALPGSFVSTPKAPFEHPAQLIVWGSFFAFTNILLFRFFTVGVPVAREYFAPVAAQVDGVYGWLAAILSALLVLGWAALDLPPAWRSLTAGSLTLPLMRFFAVVGAAVGTGVLFFAGEGALAASSVWTSFPAFSLVLSLHAVLCVWASRVVAARTGVRFGDRIGLVNVIPRHAPAGTTELHDKMTRLGDLQCGDLLRLKKGSIVPCDAIVEAGMAEVDERRFTGLAELRFKGEGQRVWAGSEIRAGEIFARVENLFPDSVISSFTEYLDKVIARNRVPERWESVAHAVVLFAAACGAIYFFRDGASLDVVGGVFAGILTASLCVDFVAYLPLLRGVALTRFFERGALCGEPAHLDTLGGVKSLVLDYSPATHSERFQISNFTVFDERLDGSQLVSALLSILGRSTDPFGVAAVEFLRGRIEEPLLHEVRDFVDYPGKGICAVVSGAEFSVGNELFLIERGVQIQASEVDDDGGGESVYVALGEEVAARFSVTGSARDESAMAIDRLHRLGVRTLMMSQEPREVVDVVGKEMTLELANITGGLSVDQYGDRLRNVAPAALACASGIPPAIARESAALFVQFDEVRFNVDPKAVTVFRGGIAPLGEFLEIAKRTAVLLRSGRLGGVLLGLAAVSLGLLAATPVWGVCLAFLAPIFLTGGVRVLRRIGPQ